MMDIPEITRRLTENAEAMRVLVQNVSAGQAQWKPDPKTWCLREVMEHIYNEERIDFRKHLKEILSVPPRPWQNFRREDAISVESCRQALEGFLDERKASIEWLESLQSPDWAARSPATPGGSGEGPVLSAGDVLVSWVAHDYLHIRQINELLFAWNEKQAKPYSVQYAGDW